MRDLPDTTETTGNDLRQLGDRTIVDTVMQTFAYIEFTPDGIVRRANQPFLETMGYRLQEIEGKHHRMFVPPDEANSAGYRAFWERIGRGEKVTGRFRRLRKDGAPVWLAATYAPILGGDGSVIGASKIAMDLSEEVALFTALTTGMESLAAGQMHHRIAARFSGERAAICQTFNKTMERLSRVFDSFAEGTSELDRLAEGMAREAGDLSDRTARIARGIEQSNVVSQELGATARQMHDAAEACDKRVRSAADSTARGSEIVASAVESMQSVEGMTADISKITKVIEGFAFQTNLLSINAAVEAARAGDAGKGFAVVASEVRNLAERSAKASRDIAALIERSTVEVNKGSRQVGAAGEVLREIDAEVRQLVQGVDAIGTAMRAQSESVAQIDRSHSGISSEIGPLSRLAEHNGEAATALTGHVSTLNADMRAFLKTP